MEDNIDLWVKVDYVKNADTYNVLLDVFERVFKNKIESIQEIKISPINHEIFIYSSRDLEKILGNICDDITLNSPNTDLISSIRVGLVGGQ